MVVAEAQGQYFGRIKKNGFPRLESRSSNGETGEAVAQQVAWAGCR